MWMDLEGIYEMQAPHDFTDMWTLKQSCAQKQYTGGYQGLGLGDGEMLGKGVNFLLKEQ